MYYFTMLEEVLLTSKPKDKIEKFYKFYKLFWIINLFLMIIIKL